jgi:glycosyltransferase involved in cell wall biosynthesis
MSAEKFVRAAAKPIVSIVILDLFGARGGVGRCTREILRELKAECVPTMLCGQSHIVDSFGEDQQPSQNFHFENLEKPAFSLKSLRIKLASKCKLRFTRLADLLLQETVKAAYVWESCLPMPILVNYPQVIAPPSSHKDFCVFIHDLNWRFYPGNFQDPGLADRNCRGWVERASKVITNSECTRDEVIEHYQCAPEKVVAAPLSPFGEKISQGFDASRYLASLGLIAGHFYLFPGVWGLHKGHDALTDAIEMSQGADPVAVTCGMPSNGIIGSTAAVAARRNSLASRWDRLIAQKKLVVVGGVSEPEMQALRAGCRAYVLPSRYEGFGFPLIEAIYHHRPALVSDIQAHREILNRYPQYKLAALFPAGSAGALTVELDRCSHEEVQMPADWQKKIEATWSWKNTVQRILSTLTSAAVLRQ